MNEKISKQNLRIIVILAVSNAAVYGLPFMKLQFYDIMIDALGFSHTQLSFVYSIYGVVCMAAYLIGGFVADMFSTKKIMIGALLLSGVLHLYTLIVSNYSTLCVIFALLGFTSVMAFYPASTKMLSCMQLKEESSGLVFGIYIAIVNVVNICLVIVGVAVLRICAESLIVYRTIIGLYGVLHFAAVIFILCYFPDNTGPAESSKVCFRKLPELLGDSKIWYVIALIFCNYLLQSAMTYSLPYLSDVYHVSEAFVLIFSIVRINMATIIVAPYAGRLADRWRSAIKMERITFFLSGILGIGILLSLSVSFPVSGLMILVLLVSAVGIAGKSINMVTITEIGVKKDVLGTAIGIVSFFGYSSDAFYYSAAGYCLDHFGPNGYKMIFLCFLVCCVLGYAACRRLEVLLSLEP